MKGRGEDTLAAFKGGGGETKREGLKKKKKRMMDGTNGGGEASGKIVERSRTLVKP